MVAAALAFEPDAFDVGVNIFGVTNWLRTLQNIPPWWEAQRESLFAEMGDPATDEERLRAISPLFPRRQHREASPSRSRWLTIQGSCRSRATRLLMPSARPVLLSSICSFQMRVMVFARRPTESPRRMHTSISSIST